MKKTQAQVKPAAPIARVNIPTPAPAAPVNVTPAVPLIPGAAPEMPRAAGRPRAMRTETSDRVEVPADKLKAATEKFPNLLNLVVPGAEILISAEKKEETKAALSALFGGNIPPAMLAGLEKPVGMETMPISQLLDLNQGAEIDYSAGKRMYVAAWDATFKSLMEFDPEIQASLANRAAIDKENSAEQTASL